MTLIDKIQEHYTKDFEVQLDLHNLAFNGKTVIGIKRLNDEETPLWRDTKGDLLQLGTITNELAKAEDKLADELTRQIESLWIVLYCFVLLSSICSLFFFTKILKNLRSQLKNLIQVVHETKETSLLINQTSEELTSGVTEQVSAIQETSASLNEISAMISKNTESSQLSLKKIMTSQESINLGKSAVNRMVNVVEIINQAGGEIVNDVENSNAEIENITKIIAKISDKTKVINDIAFQTKLLSFNASVEASRAGEHGKGFSVVAEEISNLAEVSAKSAKEIVELLNYSDNEVKNIKAKSLSNLNDIIERNQKISVNVASSVNECSQAFDQIIKDIDVINSITQEVVSASLEQSEGIEEVTKAMHQINQVTEHSSSMAQQSSNIAGKLKMESDKVYSTADNLSWLIDGESR